MALNQASIDLIKRFEGWRANAYVDPATGGEPITVGWTHGITCATQGHE